MATAKGLNYAYGITSGEIFSAKVVSNTTSLTPELLNEAYKVPLKNYYASFPVKCSECDEPLKGEPIPDKIGSVKIFHHEACLEHRACREAAGDAYDVVWIEAATIMKKSLNEPTPALEYFAGNPVQFYTWKGKPVTKAEFIRLAEGALNEVPKP